MEWQENIPGQQYTLTGGSCTAVVTLEPAHIWVAQVARMGVAIEHDNFETLMDAQAWCVTRLGEIAAADGCE